MKLFTERSLKEQVLEQVRKKEGSVYVFKNPSLRENLYKIGQSKDPYKRASSLSKNKAIIPTSFIVIYERYFENKEEAEKIIHSRLKEKGYKVENNSEFFNISLQKAIEVIEEVAHDYEQQKFDRLEKDFQNRNLEIEKLEHRIKELEKEIDYYRDASVSEEYRHFKFIYDQARLKGDEAVKKNKFSDNGKNCWGYLIIKADTDFAFWIKKNIRHLKVDFEGKIIDFVDLESKTYEFYIPIPHLGYEKKYIYAAAFKSKLYYLGEKCQYLIFEEA